MQPTRVLVARALAFALALTLAGALATAQTYDGRARTVTVAPSGGDDTAAIRTAFEVCAAVGPGCTVRLTEGTFVTRQHVVRGFDGHFVGAGADRTVVQPVTPLRVTRAPNALGQPPTDEEAWPVLFLFVDARMTLADLTFRVPDGAVTTPWSIFGGRAVELLTLVSLNGADVRVDLERISMETGLIASSRVNVFNGVFIEGVLPGPSGGFGDRPPVSGAVTVRDSRFVGSDGGVAIENADGLNVVIEGNVVDGVLSVYVQDVANGVIEVRGNDIATVDTGVFVSAGGFYTAAVAGTARGAIVRDNVFRGRATSGVRVGPAPRPATNPAASADSRSPSVGWWIAGNDASALAVTEATVWLTEFAVDAVVVRGASGTLRDEGQGTLAACD